VKQIAMMRDRKLPRFHISVSVTTTIDECFDEVVHVELTLVDDFAQMLIFRDLTRSFLNNHARRELEMGTKCLDLAMNSHGIDMRQIPPKVVQNLKIYVLSVKKYARKMNQALDVMKAGVTSSCLDGWEKDSTIALPWRSRRVNRILSRKRRIGKPMKKRKMQTTSVNSDHPRRRQIPIGWCLIAYKVVSLTLLVVLSYIIVSLHTEATRKNIITKNVENTKDGFYYSIAPTHISNVFAKELKKDLMSYFGILRFRQPTAE